MLVLSRKQGEKVDIGGHVTLTLVEVKGSQVRLSFDAPAWVRILRGELSGGTNRLLPEEELFDPDLAEKPAEWQEDFLSATCSRPAARVGAMKTPLPHRETDCSGEENAPPVATGLRILLVAGDIRVVEDLAQLLGPSGHQMWTAHDLPAALQAAERDEIDVLLLDSNVSGMEWPETAAQLRKWSPRKKPFCILLAEGESEVGLPLFEGSGFDLRMPRTGNGDFLRQFLQRFQRMLMLATPGQAKGENVRPGRRPAITLA
jgi:carbon storage regulator